MLAPPDVLSFACFFLHGVWTFVWLEVVMLLVFHLLLMWFIALNHVPLDLQLL